MPVLDWIGKDKVVNHHLDVPYHVLDRKYSFDESGMHDEDNGSGNMIIHGDNLLALKSLLPQYEGRIDCIYIDPPYNTGNEKWVYNDNVNDPVIKKWLGEVVGTEGEDLSRHDKWLCMMYPRLKLLHKLLAHDGAIFISIDSHEQSGLKFLCDEIFGRQNYIAEVACVNSPKGRDKSKNADMATAHECITIYRKSSDFKMTGFEPDIKITRRYNKIDPKTGERYRLIDLRKTGNSDERADRPNLFYPFFYNEETKDFYVGKNEDETPSGYVRIVPMKSNTIEGRWCWEYATARRDIDRLIPQYQPQKRQWSVFQIDRLEGRELVTPTTAWTFKDVNSERGTESFHNLGFTKKDFLNPKPVGTIKRIIQLGMKRDAHAIILDSFAGSGTTAQALLEQNNIDGGNREFILIEMMDYADTLTAERIKRVISGFQGEVEQEEVLFSKKLTIPVLKNGASLVQSAMDCVKSNQDEYESVSSPKIEDGSLIITGTRKTSAETAGIPGSFSYYELGEPLLKDGLLNETVGTNKIREYVYFTETKQKISSGKDDEPYFLGQHTGNSYYFYYDKDSLTTLDREFLHTIKTKSEGYVIYADLCTLSDRELERYHITFKKIPRDISRL